MKPRTRTFLRYAAFTAVALVTLAVLAGSWISYSGRREWAATKADLLARGEKLSLVELAPPEIPDDQNFFADSLWAEVFASDADGRPAVPYDKRRLNVLKENIPPELSIELDAALQGTPFRPQSAQRIYVAGRASHVIPSLDDPARREKVAGLILDMLAPLGPVLDNIEELLQRPDARSPIAYELGFRARLDHFTHYLDISRAFSARAIANLALGESEMAARDVLFTIRLGDTLRSEPILISQLLRDAALRNALSTIDAGIFMQAWTENTLAPIQSVIASTRSIDQLALGLRGERGGANTIFENLRAGPNDKDNVFRLIAGLSSNAVPQRPLSLPEQAAYLAMFRPAEQAFYNRSIQEWIDALENTGNNGVDPAKLRDPAEALLGKPLARQRFYFTLLSLSTLQTSIINRLKVQEKITLTLIACALERYRLKHGSYPEALHELEPEFLTAIPRPAIEGQTFHYEPLGETFRLWSDGWNQIDEGGKGERNARNGDWVWGDW